MKVAVTGASGFLGRHVMAELAGRDVDVVAASRRRKPDAEPSGRLRWVELDLADPPADVCEALGRPDVLIHLAWDGLSDYGSRHHFETELPRQYRFLRRCIDGGIPHLTVTGTCLEYGRVCGEIDETLEPHPENAYGFAKDALRRQLGFLQQSVPFALSWLRLFYIFGEGQAESSLIPQLDAAIRRGDLTFDMSGGEQLRDFLPVAEGARMIVTLALRRENLGIVNVCSGKPISVRRFVEERIAMAGAAMKLNLGRYPYPDYEPMAFWGATRKLKGKL
jgi:dTDP-6-deoxy-L-talose 4-dehydrogenase (NAD+)